MHGKVLTCPFELQDEVRLFLHHSDKPSELEYLADIFSILDPLNVALHGKTLVTIFNVQDKIKATRLKMRLWCGCLNRREFDSFLTLVDFLLAAGDEVDGSTVASFKQRLQDLHLQLGIYFPELDASFERIRNPFRDQTHSDQVGSNLSPREADSLVNIDFLLAPHPTRAS